MARKRTISSGVYHYLEASGILDTGSPADIAAKRKEYWNMRKRLSKQAKRKAETEFKIYLNGDELNCVSQAAKACGLSRTAYIQQSAVASARNQHMVMDKAALNHIIQLLRLNYELLQEMMETSPALPQAVLSQMAALERQVLAAVNGSQPKNSEP